jgi:GTPase
LGFTDKGAIKNLNEVERIKLPQIIEQSTKVIKFIDMGNNKNYVKTMTRNLSVNYPDYALIVIDAFEGSKKDEINK